MRNFKKHVPRDQSGQPLDQRLVDKITVHEHAPSPTAVSYKPTTGTIQIGDTVLPYDDPAFYRKVYDALRQDTRDQLIEKCKEHIRVQHCTLWMDWIVTEGQGLTKAATWLADTILAVTNLTNRVVVRDDDDPALKSKEKLT